MRARNLAVPAYLTALALLVFPIVDVTVASWPLRTGSVAWRFGTVSLVGRTLITPLLGLLLACALAAVLEHLQALRTFSVLNALATLGLAGLAVLYVLDALQLRGQVGIDQVARFQLGSAATLAKLGLGALITLTLAVVSWGISGAMAARVRRAQADEGGRIVAPTGSGSSARPAGAAPEAR